MGQVVLIKNLFSNPGSFDYQLINRAPLEKLASDVFSTMDLRVVPGQVPSEHRPWSLALAAEELRPAYPTLWKKVTGERYSEVSYLRASLYRRVTETVTAGISYAGSEGSSVALYSLGLNYFSGDIWGVTPTWIFSLNHLDLDRIGLAKGVSAGLQIQRNMNSFVPYISVIWARSTLRFGGRGIDSVSQDRAQLGLGVRLRAFEDHEFVLHSARYDTGQHLLTANYLVNF